MKPHGSGKQRGVTNRTRSQSTPRRTSTSSSTRSAATTRTRRRRRRRPSTATTRRRRWHDKLSAQVCAATLQYGLFEQGRLFGIPDVIAPFVIDNRVDRSLHFIGEWIYDAMYVTPTKKAGDILADPKSKLEMYIAYRLSSTSIWAILVANVAGYMMVRALAPTAVYILKFVGVTSNKRKSGDGRRFTSRSSCCGHNWVARVPGAVRQPAGHLLDLVDRPGDAVALLHHDRVRGLAGLGVQVPSGAFGTTWGKRRYARFGEHLIGILLVLTFLFVLFSSVMGRALVDPLLRARRPPRRSRATTRGWTRWR